MPSHLAALLRGRAPMVVRIDAEEKQVLRLPEVAQDDAVVGRSSAGSVFFCEHLAQAIEFALPCDAVIANPSFENGES